MNRWDSYHKSQITRRRSVRRAAALLAALCLLGPVAAAAGQHAVVFMYHRFGDDRYPSTNVTIGQLEAHLDHLEGQNYRVWSLKRVVRHIRTGRPIPDRTVALTVDDAYASVYHEAFPRLRRRGWPFTVFVATDPVDRDLDGYLTWEQMREMQAAGVHFASHSASHDHLAVRRPGEDRKAWERRVRQDLERARRRLAEELGPRPDGPALFAYPYGEFDTALAELVRGMGYVAFGQHSGAVGPGSDRRALPRYPMAEAFAATEAFALKAASLPLPIAAVEPWDPAVDENPPRLELTLVPGSARPERLRCYLGGEPLTVEWLEPGRRLSVRADRPLAPPRSRYNCTAPGPQGRYYWYSHPWLIRPSAGREAD